jgi:phosphoglucomutase
MVINILTGYNSSVMRIEDREDFVDMVAQAVIDRIEESSKVTSLVDAVVKRVFELQKQEEALKTEAENGSVNQNTTLATEKEN